MAAEEKAALQKDEKEKRSQESESKPDQQPKKQPEKPPLYKRRGFIPAVIIIAVVLIVVCGIAWFILRQYVYTDDAYIDGHVTQVSARVSSQVLALHIVDNQFVHQGDLLIEPDPTTFQVALEQANAQVESALVQFGNADRDFKRFAEVGQRALCFICGLSAPQ